MNLKGCLSKNLLLLTALSLLSLSACVKTTTEVTGTSEESASPVQSGQPQDGKATTITVSTMRSERWLEMAKKLFEENHPLIKVEIKNYGVTPVQNGNSFSIAEQDIEKFVKGIGTELMSGKGSDLIVMNSNLPSRKYADKNLLENLDQWISKDSGFSKGEYYTNIFEGMKYDDGLYVLPLAVSLNLMLGNKAILQETAPEGRAWTWRDWAKTVQSLARDDNKDGIPDAYALTGTGPEALIRRMVSSSYGNFVNEAKGKASFDSPEFKELLGICKSLSDSKLITPERNDKMTAMFELYSPVQYIDAILYPQMKFNGQALRYNLPTEAAKQGLTFNAGAYQLAMNSRSANKQAAWEFMKFMLSEKFQSSEEIYGFVVSKQAEQTRMEHVLKSFEPQADGTTQTFSFNGAPVTPKKPELEHYDWISKYMNDVQSGTLTDSKVLSIVGDEAASFFNGQRTAEEAAKSIQNKVSTYLQE